MVGYQRKHIWFDFRKSSLRSQKQVHFRSQMSFECILNKNISSVKTALQLAEWFILKEIDGEEPGSIPARPCRFSRSESSVVFCINTCEDPLERPPTEGTSPADPGLTCWQLALLLQPKSSVRKTPPEGTLPTDPGHTSGQLALTLQSTNQPKSSIKT